jgi:hypothetical protein
MRVTNDRPELLINERHFDNKTTLIGYWQRPHKFLFIKWGKKETFIESSAKCGETVVQKVEIVKK